MKFDGARLPVPTSTAEAVESTAAGPVSTTRRPHVCFVSMNLYPILNSSAGVEFAGGGEVQQAIVARLLQANGVRVSVLTGDYGQPAFEDRDGIHVHRVPAPGTRGIKGLRFIHPLMTDVLAGLNRIDPDIVYYRVAGFRAAAAAFYARTRGKRFVYACASDREFQARSVSGLPRRDEWLFRAALRSADAILVQNIRQRELLATSFGRDSVIVPNCHAEPNAGRAAHEGAVVWVGIFKPVKRPELFIELARRFPSKRFVMVGGADNANDPDQAYHRQMRAMAAGVSNLEFVGFVPFSRVGQYFDDACVLVNTSDREGFPNTFLQAWVRGVPSVSFVQPEVEPGQVGTIVCADLDDMAARLGELITHKDSWRAASRDCEVHFGKNHDTDAVLRKYLSLFDHLLRADR